MMTFEEKLDYLFDNSIDVNDTIWYTSNETLRDAIMRIFSDADETP